MTGTCHTCVQRVEQFHRTSCANTIFQRIVQFDAYVSYSSMLTYRTVRCFSARETMFHETMSLDLIVRFFLTLVILIDIVEYSTVSSVSRLQTALLYFLQRKNSKRPGVGDQFVLDPLAVEKQEPSFMQAERAKQIDSMKLPQKKYKFMATKRIPTSTCGNSCRTVRHTVLILVGNFTDCLS